MNITWIDWAVLIIYLVMITAIGVMASKKTRNVASFFIGDRSFNRWFMVFFNFGSGTHSDQAISVASKTYQSGASGIWYQWLYLLITPFYWLLAPLYRRTRALTTGEYFDFRYGRSVSGLYAAMGILQMTFNMGLMLFGSERMITAVTGGMMDPQLTILVMTVLFVTYGLAGGLNAAIYTDFIQGWMTIVLSFLILPFALDAVGGLSGLKETVQSPWMFELVASDEITLFYIAVIALNGLIGWVSLPYLMSTCGAAKTEADGRVGVVYGAFIKRVCTVAWMLTGLCALGIFAGMNETTEIDQVYGLMARELLPGIGPGLLGIFIASMLASVMSSCDTYMITCSALFTRDLYRRFWRPGKSDSHYMLVGRIAAGTFVVCSVLVAFNLSDIVRSLQIFWQISAIMGVAWMTGLLWRGTTVAGAWAGTIATLLLIVFTSKVSVGMLVLWDFNATFIQSMQGNWLNFMVFVNPTTGSARLYLPWQMLIYLSGGFGVTVLVSLYSSKVPEERLNRFYMCMRTPVDQEEVQGEPFTLPPGISPAPRRVMFDYWGLEIPIPRRSSIVGFLTAWAVVAAIIASTYLLFNSL